MKSEVYRSSIHPTLLGVCALLMLMWLPSTGCERAVDPVLPAREIGTVDLRVEFGGSRPAIEVAIPCSIDSTAFTTLQRADQNGDLKLSASGDGETAFVHSIDGVAGDSAAETYWFFFVNDQLGARGSGVVEVDPGDRVRWSYQRTPAALEE